MRTRSAVLPSAILMTIVLLLSLFGCADSVRTEVEGSNSDIWVEDIAIGTTSRDSQGIIHRGKRQVIVSFGTADDIPPNLHFRITLKSGMYNYGTQAAETLPLNLRRRPPHLTPKILEFFVPEEDLAFIQENGFKVEIR